jgi:hypothetical protein
MASRVDRETVFEVYKEVLRDNPNAILKDVVQALADRGIKNPSTRKPYTLSTVHYALQRFPEAQQLKGNNNTHAESIVVRMADYPLISQWLETNITKAEVVDEKDLTKNMVRGRWLYGWAKPAILMACARVWWPFIPRVGPVLEDMELDNTIYFRTIDLKKVY